MTIVTAQPGWVAEMQVTTKNARGTTSTEVFKVPIEAWSDNEPLVVSSPHNPPMRSGSGFPVLIGVGLVRLGWWKPPRGEPVEIRCFGIKYAPGLRTEVSFLFGSGAEPGIQTFNSQGPPS